jgi:NAD(P)-dependent dehydrogenase (short-subunit alcohol dehydrogenase family)
MSTDGHPVVVVTGGASGIGRAICDHFGEKRAALAILDRDEAALAETSEILVGRGSIVEPYAVDVSESAAIVETFGRIVSRFGRVDVLINNAGLSVGGGAPTHDLPDEAWLETISVMQTGVFYCSKAAGKIMVDQRFGSIINIASVRGFAPRAGRLAYCASKAAVLMMTRVMASEWGEYGVRVNAVAPGVTETPLWERLVVAGKVDEQQFLRATPLGRLAQPNEIASLCGYLASDDAAFVTGACFTIDGGLTNIFAA